MIKTREIKIIIRSGINVLNFKKKKKHADQLLEYLKFNTTLISLQKLSNFFLLTVFTDIPVSLFCLFTQWM